MKQTIRRVTALLLALSFCLSLFGVTVWAAERAAPEAQSSEANPSSSEAAAASGQDPAASGNTGDTSAGAEPAEPAEPANPGGSGDGSGSGNGSGSSSETGSGSGNGSGSSSETGSGNGSGSSSETGNGSGSGSETGSGSGDSSGSGGAAPGQQTDEDEGKKSEQEQKSLEEEETADSKSDQEEEKPAPVKPAKTTKTTTTTTANTTTTTAAEDSEDPINLERMCGEDLTWSLGGTTLTVSGTGPMWNFDGSDSKHLIPPWDEAADYVKKIIIGAEVASLGAMAFQDCVNLDEVTFESSTTTYENSTFRGTPWWRLAQFRKSVEISPDSTEKLNSENAEEVFVYSFAPGVTDEYRLSVVGAKGAKARVSLYDDQGGILFRERSSRQVNLTRIQGAGERVFLLVEPLGDSPAKYTVSVSSTALPPLMGTCGDGLTWVLDSVTETLTVSGTGEMEDYKDRSAIPWRELSPIVARLKVENGVTTIGRNAFEDCQRLESVELPATLERVGERAFALCSSLTDVHLSASTKVPENAFADTPWRYDRLLGTAPALTTDTGAAVQLDKDNQPNRFRFAAEQDGVFRLESSGVAMKKSTPLASVWKDGKLLISGAAPEFSAQAGEEFLLEVRSSAAQKKGAAWTVTLKQVPTEEALGALRWSLKDGTLTVSGEGDLRSGETGWPWEHLRGEIRSLVLENGVKSVGKGAFEYCTRLESVTLSDSVTSIGEGAFYDCPYLHQLNLGAGLTSIGKGAFNSCYGLVSLTVPESVTSVGEYAFAECTTLKDVTVKQGLKYPKNAFSGTPWQRVSGNWSTAQVLQAGVERTVILNKGKPRMYFSFTPLEDGYYLFSSSSTQDSGNPVAYLYTAEGTELSSDDDSGEDQDFCLGFTLRKDTKYIFCVATNPEAKGKQAYSYDVSLQATVLASSGTCGAQLSWSLEKGILTISGNGRMDDFSSAAAAPWAAWSEQITTVKVQQGVGTIGTFAFDNLISMTYAELPEGLISIGSSAFGNCVSLKSLTLPVSLRSFGGDVFSHTDENFTIAAEPGSLGHVYARRSALKWMTPAEKKEDDIAKQG